MTKDYEAVNVIEDVTFMTLLFGFHLTPKDVRTNWRVDFVITK